jgi:hypothetical protein
MSSHRVLGSQRPLGIVHSAQPTIDPTTRGTGDAGSAPRILGACDRHPFKIRRPTPRWPKRLARERHREFGPAPAIRQRGSLQFMKKAHRSSSTATPQWPPMAPPMDGITDHGARAAAPAAALSRQAAQFGMLRILLLWGHNRPHAVQQNAAAKIRARGTWPVADGDLAGCASRRKTFASASLRQPSRAKSIGQGAG